MKSKWKNTQGWDIQLQKAEYPLVKKKRVYRYKLSKEVRLVNLVAKKFIAQNRLLKQEHYPKGRLLHLERQMRRLEYYVEAHAL